MKAKQIIIEDKIYNFSWLVLFGGDYQNAIDVYAKRLGIEPWESPPKGKCHQANFTAHHEYRIGVIWFADKKPLPSIVAHECLHAVIYLAEKLIVEINHKTEEVFCYYIQMLMERICESSKS